MAFCQRDLPVQGGGVVSAHPHIEIDGLDWTQGRPGQRRGRGDSQDFSVPAKLHSSLVDYVKKRPNMLIQFLKQETNDKCSLNDDADDKRAQLETFVDYFLSSAEEGKQLLSNSTSADADGFIQVKSDRLARALGSDQISFLESATSEFADEESERVQIVGFIIACIVVCIVLFILTVLHWRVAILTAMACVVAAKHGAEWCFCAFLGFGMGGLFVCLAFALALPIGIKVLVTSIIGGVGVAVKEIRYYNELYNGSEGNMSKAEPLKALCCREPTPATHPNKSKLMQEKVEQATLQAWKDRAENGSGTAVVPCESGRAAASPVPGAARSPSPNSQRQKACSPVEKMMPSPLGTASHGRWRRARQAARQDQFRVAARFDVQMLQAGPAGEVGFDDVGCFHPTPPCSRASTPHSAVPKPVAEVRTVKQWLRDVTRRTSTGAKESTGGVASGPLLNVAEIRPLKEQLRRWSTRLALRDEVWLEFTLGSLRAECLLLADTMLTMHDGFVAVVGWNYFDRLWPLWEWAVFCARCGTGRVQLAADAFSRAAGVEYHRAIRRLSVENASLRDVRDRPIILEALEKLFRCSSQMEMVEVRKLGGENGGVVKERIVDYSSVERFVRATAIAAFAREAALASSRELEKADESGWIGLAEEFGLHDLHHALKMCKPWDWLDLVRQQGAEDLDLAYEAMVEAWWEEQWWRLGPRASCPE
eukprot:s290_g5.t1